MLYAGLDLSRKRIDVCLRDEDGRLVGETAVPSDADGLRSPVERFRPLSSAAESDGAAPTYGVVIGGGRREARQRYERQPRRRTRSRQRQAP